MTRLIGVLLIAVAALVQDWRGMDTGQVVLTGLVILVGAAFVIVGTIFDGDNND